MAKAIVDPAEVRRFAHNLKQFTNDVHGRMLVLNGQLANLGETWRDQEHEKFAEDFQQTLQVVERFLEAANKHIPFLLRKAERAEQYLEQR